MNISNYNTFIEALLSLKTKKELKGFLDGILTPKERKEIPVRFQIVKLLKKGMPQHEIATKLGVGIATVTRGSKELSKGNFSNWR
ncbi:MAG: Trp family transcriptional regulator [Candidatus Roizmanbacteria bacterium]|nr:Trp family transcriptional regulator [Candidatus Roizmanbacteria bacterium]